MAMEFWGVEVKAGEPLKVEHVEGLVLHLSQAALGEAKKDKANESVVLYANVEGKKLVIGTLSADKCPQISYDLVFDKEVELSHNWKHGSVYLCGYTAEMDEGSDVDGMFDSDFESEEEAEEVPAAVPVNGKPELKADKSKVVADKVKAAKPDSSKVKNAKPDEDSDDDDSDEENDDSEEDESDDEEMVAEGESDDDDDDDDDDSSEEEEEDTPKNAKQNKKRPAEQPATKTPAPEKKAKLVTPQKSGGDGKKGNAHTATPHPSKGGKTNTKADKPKQSPKSGSKGRNK